MKNLHWRFSVLDKFVPDRLTDSQTLCIVTPWAPDGAKNVSNKGVKVYLHEPSLHCKNSLLVSDLFTCHTEIWGADGLCLESCVNLNFVRVTRRYNTLFIWQLLWIMNGLLWHEAEINKTTTTSDGKTGTNFLAPGKWCSPKLSKITKIVISLCRDIN